MSHKHKLVGINLLNCIQIAVVGTLIFAACSIAQPLKEQQVSEYSVSTGHITDEPETHISMDAWRFSNQMDVHSNWQAIDYDDNTWDVSTGAVGYGVEWIEADVLEAGHLRYMLRTTLHIEHLSALEGLRANIHYDDGFIAYLNGQEWFRSDNVSAGPLTIDTHASPHSSDVADIFEKIDITRLREGDNTLAVALINRSVDSSDAAFDIEFEAAVYTPLVRGPYLQNATPGSVVVRWRTDKPTHSVVHYGASANELNHSVESHELVTEHIVEIAGLSAESTYYYSIGDGEKTFAAGKNCYFTTLPDSQKTDFTPARVWIIGDSGTANQNQRNVYQAYLDFAETHDMPADVWLQLGDNAYNHGSDAQFQAAMFDMYTDMLQNTCQWSCLGNHETDYGQSHVYYDIYTLPTQGEAGGVPSGSESYYSFDYGRIHFICLDSATRGDHRTVGSAMYQWLEQDLQAAQGKYDWVIAFWHHPPYTRGSHNSDERRDSNGRMHDMREVFLPLLEANGVDMVFSGHSHSYERSILMDGHYDTSDTYHEATHAIDAGDGRLDGDGGYEVSTEAISNHGTVYTVAGSSGKCSGGALDLPFMISNHRALGSVLLDIQQDVLTAIFIDDTGEVLDRYVIERVAPQNSSS